MVEPEEPTLTLVKAHVLLKEFALTSYPSCKYLTCDRVVWTDQSKRHYDFCGKGHALEFSGLQELARAYVDAPVMIRGLDNAWHVVETPDTAPDGSRSL